MDGQKEEGIWHKKEGSKETTTTIQNKVVSSQSVTVCSYKPSFFFQMIMRLPPRVRLTGRERKKRVGGGPLSSLRVIQSVFVSFLLIHSLLPLSVTRLARMDRKDCLQVRPSSLSLSPVPFQFSIWARSSLTLLLYTKSFCCLIFVVVVVFFLFVGKGETISWRRISRERDIYEVMRGWPTVKGENLVHRLSILFLTPKKKGDDKGALFFRVVLFTT